MRVALNDIYDNWTPGDDIAVLRIFVQADKAADDVGAEPGDVS